jgi:hypothetical protein
MKDKWWRRLFMDRQTLATAFGPFSFYLLFSSFALSLQSDWAFFSGLFVPGCDELYHYGSERMYEVKQKQIKRIHDIHGVHSFIG